MSISHEKLNFRNILYNIPMSEETVQALCLKIKVLDDMHEQFNEFREIGDFYEFAAEYLERAECDYLAEQVFSLATLEYQNYVDKVKVLPPQEIIDSAYNLTMLSDLHTSLAPIPGHGRSANQLKALLADGNPLWSVYRTWQKSDYSFLDDMQYFIGETADRLCAEHGIGDFTGENELEAEAEDGQEI